MKSSTASMFVGPRSSAFYLFHLACGWGVLISSLRAEPVAGSASSASLPNDALQQLGNARFQHGRPIVAATLSSSQDVLLTAGRDHWIQLWRVSTGQLRAKARQEWISAVALSPDGSTIASGDEFGAVCFWAINGNVIGKPVIQATKHRTPVRALGFSPDGQCLVSMSDDAQLCAWKWKGSSTALDKAFAIEGVKLPTAVACSSDGKIVLGNKEGVLFLWSLSTQKRQAQWQGHQGAILDLQCSQEGNTVTSFGRAGKRRTWDLATQKQVSESQTSHVDHNVATVSVDEKRLAVGKGHRVEVWDVEKNVQLHDDKTGFGTPLRMVVSQNGTTLAILNRQGTVHVVDAESGKTISRAQAKAGSTNLTALSADGKTFAWASANSVVDMYDVLTGKKLATLANPANCSPQAMAFAADAKTLAVNYHNSKGDHQLIRLWDVKENAEIRTFQVPVLVQQLAFAGKDSMLVGTAKNQSIYVWGTARGRQLFRWGRKHNGKGILAVSPDGTQVATGGHEGVITLTELRTGDSRYWSGHSGDVSDLAFSKDGRSLLSCGSWDDTVMLWETSTGQVVRRFRGHLGGAMSVGLSSDGQKAFSLGKEGQVLTWDVTGLKSGRVASINNDAKRRGTYWQKLTDDDTAQAYDAMWALVEAPVMSLPVIREAMKPWVSNDAKRIRKLILGLDHISFDVRQSSTDELARILELAEPALRRAVANPPSLEVRMRAVRLLGKLRAPSVVQQDVRRLRRAVVVLEKIGHEEAQSLLEEVANQTLLPELQGEAKSALERLSKD